MLSLSLSLSLRFRGSECDMERLILCLPRGSGLAQPGKFIKCLTLSPCGMQSILSPLVLYLLSLSISPNLQRFYISDISALLSNIILHTYLALSMCFSICKGVVCHLLTPLSSVKQKKCRRLHVKEIPEQ